MRAPFHLCLSAILAAVPAAAAYAQSTPPAPPPPPPPRAAPVFERQTPLAVPRRPESSRWNNPGAQSIQSAILYRRLYQAAEQTSRCASRLNRAQADEVFRAPTNTYLERWQVRQLAATTAGCYSAGYSAPQPLLRGALAEALYRRDERASAAAGHAMSASDAARFDQLEHERRRNASSEDRQLAAYANCLVQRAPDAVHSMLGLDHGSPRERAALDAALGAGSACARGVPKPATDGSRTYLRAYLAEAAYRWRSFDPSDRSGD